MTSLTRGRILDVSIVVAGLVFLAQLVAPPARFQEVMTPRSLVAVGAVAKLAFLFLATRFAFRNTSRFDRGSTSRLGWRLLSLGFLGFLLGQLCLAPYQLVLFTQSPFPSIADLFFCAGYPFFIAALLAFARAYDEAGCPAPAHRRMTAVLAAVGLALVAVPLLWPIAATPAPPLEKLLNLAYPGLDLVLLVPTLLLIRTTLPLRGGQVGRVWVTLLAGFVSMCVGDIAFAYVSTLGEQSLDPLLHAMYILSYGLCARGVLQQDKLLTV